MIIISNFLFNFTNFCIIICSLTKLPPSGLLFSAAVNTELVAKPLILGILFYSPISRILKRFDYFYNIFHFLIRYY